MKIIPDIPPKLFSLSAVAIGYLLIDDTTATEQNALGNWLMLVAQILCTNAYYKQLQIERKSSESDINVEELIKKINKALNTELDNLKKG